MPSETRCYLTITSVGETISGPASWHIGQQHIFKCREHEYRVCFQALNFSQD
jgi:hypothetical protein